MRGSLPLSGTGPCPLGLHSSETAMPELCSRGCRHDCQPKLRGSSRTGPGASGKARNETLANPAVLKRLTNVKWREYDGWFRRVETTCCRADIRSVRTPLLLIIRPPWRLPRILPFRLPRHAVVLYGGWVHDPGFPTGVRRDQYPRRDWIVVRIYRPRHPELLNTTRLHNWVDRNLLLSGWEQAKVEW